MNIYSSGANPALQLYNFWAGILDGFDSKGVPLGHQRGYGIGVVKEDSNGRPILGYGVVGNGVHPAIEITVDGDFRIKSLHGYKQRSGLEAMTFLDSGYTHSEYVWRIDTVSRRRRQWRGHFYSDFNTRPEYLSEKAMRCRTYGTDSPWIKCVLRNGQWVMDFSREGDLYPHSTPVESFERYHRIRERRYNRMEREHLIRTGQAQPPAARKPRLTEDEIEERNERDAQMILAHMDVSRPARSIPLRRRKEEGLWPAPVGTP